MYWERIFDFGNGPNVDNILFGRPTTSTNIYVDIRNPVQNFQVSGAIQAGVWQTFACRLQKETSGDWRWTIWVDGTQYTGGTFNSPPPDRTLTRSYIGRSNWTGYDDYSALNLREMWWYDHALSDTGMNAIISDIKHGY